MIITVDQELYGKVMELNWSKNIHFSFWWGYMEMVSILLMFT